MGCGMSNNNIPPGAKEVFISDSGDNNNFDNSSSPNFPVLTIAQAIAKANSLNPVINDQVLIKDIGTSLYDENMLVPDNVFVDFTNSSIRSPGGTAVEGPDNGNLQIFGIQTSINSNDVAFSTGPNSRMGLTTLTIVLIGNNQSAFVIGGSSDQIFITVSQVTSIGNDNVAFTHTSTSASSSYKFDEINMLGTDSIAIQFNSSSSDVCEMRGGSITAPGTGNSGIVVIEGQLSVYVNVIDAPNAIVIEDGGTLNIFDADVIGNIVVNTGGTLNCTITSLTGTVTNNGTINGFIGNPAIDTTRYGTLKYDQDFSGTYTDRSLIDKAFAESLVPNPGGADTQIQFNDGGAFGADADLTYNKTTNTLTTDNVDAETHGVKGSTSGQVTVDAPAVVTSDYSLTLPPADGVDGQILERDSSGNLQWVNDSTVPAGSDTEIQFNDSGSFGASPGYTFSSSFPNATETIGSGLNGLATRAFKNSSSVIKGVLEYDENTDTLVLKPQNSANLLIDSTAGTNTNINLAAATANFLEITGVSKQDIDKLLTLTNSGTNGGSTDFYISDRTPDLTITANPGSICFSADGVQSKIYIHEGSGTTNTDWQEVQTKPTGTISIHSGSIHESIEFSDSSTQTQGALPNYFQGSTIDATLRQTFDISTEDTIPNALTFKPDGLKMYVVGNDGNEINEYDLSIAWDVSTAVFLQLKNVGPQATFPQDVDFRIDGTRMYVTSSTTQEVIQYTLSTAWSVITALHDSGSNLDVSGEASSPIGSSFNPNGLQLYVTNPADDTIYVYDLTTAWDLSTASYSGNSLDVSSDVTGLSSIDFRLDGVFMYLSHALTPSEFHTYKFDEPWNINTARFINTFTDNNLASLRGMSVSPEAHKFYVVDRSTPVTVVEYDMALTPLDIVAERKLESDSLFATGAVTFSDNSTQTKADRAVGTSTPIANLSFVQAFDVSVEETAPNDVAFKPDGLSMYVLGNSSDRVNQYNLTTAWDVSSASFSQFLSVSAQDGFPEGLFFKPDGTKMYFCGQTQDSVFEYALSTPWSVSTGSLINTFSVATEDLTPVALVFRPDGLAFFICGFNNEEVFKYSMTNPWDTSNASYTGVSFSITTEGDQPRGMIISPDGNKMYVSFDTANNFQEYILTTPWDITSSVVGGVFDPSIQLPRGLCIEPSEGKFYLAEGSNDTIREYDLPIRVAGLILDTVPITGTLYDTDGTISLASANRNVNLTDGDSGSGLLIDASDTGTTITTAYFQDSNEINLVSDDSTTGQERINVSATTGIELLTAGSGLIPVIDTERISRVAPEVIEVFTSADLDAIASGGIITISADQQLIFKDDIATSNRFVTDGATLRMGGAGSSFTLTYTGTGVFLGGNGGYTIRTGVTLQSASTGTLWGVDVPSNTTVVHQDANWINWDDFGTIKGGIVVIENINLVLWTTGLTLDSNELVDVDTIGSLFPPASGDMFSIFNREQENAIYRFQNAVGILTGTSVNIYDIDPAILNSTQVTITLGAVVDGANFNTSGSTASFTAVADSSVGVTSISSVTDSGGIARFNFAVGPTMHVHQEAAISGFVTNTDYNVTGFITTTGLGFFEIASIAFGTDEGVGSFTSDSITVTSASHGLGNGVSLVIDTDLSTDYDGGAVTYQATTNSFRINRTFIATETGNWNTGGLDQTDPRVLTFLQQQEADSHYIATAFVNNNTTATGTIVNNTFTDLVFGTGGSALIAGSTLERWKLIDELNGTFEYTGNEPFDGLITFDFTVVSSGGTVDFRFKWEIDTGSGFVNLTDNVEALVAVSSSAQSITKTFPLVANNGDQIKPQITRNSGTSGITTSYATIYATQ